MIRGGDVRTGHGGPPPCFHCKPPPFRCPQCPCPPLQECVFRPVKCDSCPPLNCRSPPPPPPLPPSICIPGPCPEPPGPVPYTCPPPPRFQPPPTCLRFCIRNECGQLTYFPCYSLRLPNCVPKKEGGCC